jgi:hypothetical protein
MKRHISILSIIVLTLAAVGFAQGYPPAPPDNNSRSVGLFYAANYAYGYNAITPLKVFSGVSYASGTQTIQLASGFTTGPDGRIIAPFNSNVMPSITIGTASDVETVTPTSATNCGPNSQAPGTCTITATFSNAHGGGEPIISGSLGLQEALDDASQGGSCASPQGGTVVVDSYWAQLGGSNTTLAAATPLPCVAILNQMSGSDRYWSIQPTNTTALATPTTRVGSASGCTGTNTVCDTSIAVASGGFTNAAQYVWVAYVDMQGNVGKASLTANYTTAGAVQIEFLAPAASAGAVGWIFGIGTSYAAAYWIPPTAANCTLSTLTPYPTCAITNSTYGTTGSNAFIAKPQTTFALYPIPGGVANAYNPNFLTHTAFAYQPSGQTPHTVALEYGPFTATAALTAGQFGVLGTVPLGVGFLNFQSRSITIHGKFNYTPTTGGTAPGVLVSIGDITDFSTGTPKALCTEVEVHSTTTAAYGVDFTCTLQTQSTGTTGTIQPGGFLIDAAEAGTTLGIATVEQDTGPITADVQDQDLLYVIFEQTTSAETTGPQLQKLEITVNQ